MSITSENIQFYRKQRNLTQSQLASLTNMSRSTIASYESGRTEPDITSLQNFSNIFNASIDDLLCTSQAVLTQRNNRTKKFCYLFIAIINVIMLFRNFAISLLSNSNFDLPVGTPLDATQLQTLHLIDMISNCIVFAEGMTIVLCISFYFATFIKFKKASITLKLFVTVNILLSFSIFAQTLIFIVLNVNAPFYDYFHIIQSIALYAIPIFLLLLIANFLFKNKSFK